MNLLKIVNKKNEVEDNKAFSIKNNQKLHVKSFYWKKLYGKILSP